MQQRQLRLGDILDDYCPRERRVTNHAVVAMIGEDVKQTRCTTCDADHEYKHAKVPRQRRKSGDARRAVCAGPGERSEARHARGATGDADIRRTARRRPANRSLGDRRSRGRRRLTADTERAGAPMPDDIALRSRRRRRRRPTRRRCRRRGCRDDEEDGPVHRPLIRASLPQHEGQPPPARPIPEFTIRQPGGRPPTASGRVISAAAQPAVAASSSRGTVRAAATCTAARRAAVRARAAAGRLRATAARRCAATVRAQALEVTSSATMSRSVLAMMPDLSGKHGLIVGVANKRSISWAIAQAAAAAGARLALTYPSERLEENVRELAATARQSAGRCRATSPSDQQIADLGATLDREFGGLDFLRPRRGVRAGRRAEESVRAKRRARASASRSTSAPTR